jgi:hypothetical protein
MWVYDAGIFLGRRQKIDVNDVSPHTITTIRFVGGAASEKNQPPRPSQLFRPPTRANRPSPCTVLIKLDLDWSNTPHVTSRDSHTINRVPYPLPFHLTTPLIATTTPTLYLPHTLLVR